MTLHELSGPFLRSRVALRPALEAAFRRSVDIIFVCAAMFLLAPVILVVALAIWIEGGRPILFSQLRLGQRGGRSECTNSASSGQIATTADVHSPCKPTDG